MSTQITDAQVATPKLLGRAAALALGRGTINMAGTGDYTALITEYIYPVLELSGILTGARGLVLPLTAGAWFTIKNGCTGNFQLTVKGASGTGVTIPQGATATVYTDGTNFYYAARDPAWPVYGELFEDTPAGTTLTVATAGTYVGWTTAGAGNVSGNPFLAADTAQATGDRLTVGVEGAGVYEVSATAFFKGPNNANCKLAIHKSGTIQTDLKGYIEFDATAKVKCAVVRGLITLAAGEYLDLRFDSNTNADVLTLYNVNLTMRRISL